MTMTYEDTEVTSGEELDLSGDSAVEVKQAVWTIIEAELEETESDNGSGKRYNITLESDDFPFDITLRFFVEYAPNDEEKDTTWVKRQRGMLTNLTKAATGGTNFNPKTIVGRKILATTRDSGDGFPTLSKFKKVPGASEE